MLGTSSFLKPMLSVNQSPANVEDGRAMYPMSAMQRGMLFNSCYQPQPGTDIEQVICRLDESVDIVRLQQAWQRIQSRYIILNATITGVDAHQPQLLINPELEIPFEPVDWSGASSAYQVELLESWLASDRTRGFDLMDASAPLMRFHLLQFAPTQFQLVWTLHHLLLDGRSITKVLQEFFGLYDALRGGVEYQFALHSPYRDYLRWQQTQDFSVSQSFWQDLLKGFDAVTPLMPIQASPDVLDHPGHQTQAIDLTLAQTSDLKALAQRLEVTPNTIIQGLWGLLLSRYSGKQDVVFGTTRACRRSSIESADNVVGLLINTVPVRVQPEPERSLEAYLKDLRHQHVAVRPHENTPLTQIQAWSEIPGGTPLFESLVVFENYQVNHFLQQQDSAWLHRYVSFREQPSFPLVLLAVMGEGLELKISYDQTRFDRATIERLLGHLQTMLCDVLTQPQQTLGNIAWLRPAEAAQLLVQWNQTQRGYDADCLLHELFEQQVAQSPDAVALVEGTQQLTYRELNQRSNQLAHYLVEQGLEPGEAVAIYLGRGFSLIIALFAVLKAGGCYVPLEPHYPNSRVQWIADSLALRYCISEPPHRDNLQPVIDQVASLQTVIWLDLCCPKDAGVFDCDAYPASNLPRQVSPQERAYIIFTSGSTGTPKGVVVHHAAVTNLIDWVNRKFEISPRDRALFITSVCFDLSVYDIFGLLAAGGSIYIASQAEIDDPYALIAILQRSQITFWNSAPPMLQQLVPLLQRRGIDRRQPSDHSRQRFGWRDRRRQQRRQNNAREPQLRLVFLSGDWVPMDLPDFLKAQFANVQVVALGGATEATVWSNFYEVEQLESVWNSIPYGKPIQNAQYYILDEQNRPCPIGVTGELYIGGVCLAMGYTDAGKTAAQFLPHPFSELSTDRIYRTGDLARFFPDGNIEFLGRVDHQVKIRGYRIELGEIAAMLNQHPQVETAIVLAKPSQVAEKRDPSLVAYVVLQLDRQSRLTETTDWSLAEFFTHELPQFLSQSLPRYMVPQAFIEIDQIPLTANGKLDRQALFALPSETLSENQYVSPQTRVEHQLAEIWQRILHVEAIGRTDNFFELGGHSLLAVELIAQIEAIFGHQLSLSLIFQSPTIAQMAPLLEMHPMDNLMAALIPVKRGGPSRSPLFVCEFYDELAPYLPADLPVYGIDAGILDIRQPQDHIRRYATSYIEQIRRVQPHGPYHFLGYCFGGYVVLEIAQQLRQQGEEVGLLTLLESYGPLVPFYQSSFSWDTLWLLATSVKRRLREKRRLKQFMQQPAADLMRCPASVYEMNQMISREAVQTAVQYYALEPYDGNVLLLSGDTSHLGSRFLSRLGWGEIFTGQCRVQNVTGGHISLFQEPHVCEVANLIEAALHDCDFSTELASTVFSAAVPLPSAASQGLAQKEG